MPLEAVIFDLDGVLTDTAEYHYLAWKQLAMEEGLAFDREDNEALRGVSRRESLLRLLKGRSLPEEELQELMARKNSYYQQWLTEITPDDLLPGVQRLIIELEEAELPFAVASASRNAAEVVRRLGIAEKLSLLADGNAVERQKPAPDLFRFSAAGLGVPHGRCLVVEDAAAGVKAALAAGMPALALGPEERFNGELSDHGKRFQRLDDLENVRLADLAAAAKVDPCWNVIWDTFDAESQQHMETVFTVGNGHFCSRGSFEESYPDDSPLTLAHGIFNDVPIFYTELVNLPRWFDFRLTVNGHSVRLDKGDVEVIRLVLELRHGIVHRHLRWRAPDDTVVDISFERFASYARQHLGAQRVILTAVNQPAVIDVQSSIDGHVVNDRLVHWEHLDQGEADDRTLWLHSRTRDSGIEMGTAVRFFVSGDARLICQKCPGQPAFSWRESLEPGQSIQVDKVASFVSDRDPGVPSEDVLNLTLEKIQGVDYDELLAEHLRAWEEVWRDVDVIIEGDDEAQLTLRFSLYHLQIAAPRHDDRVSIGAKALSGLGYRGHVFWDTEIFVLPFFTFTQPEIAKNLLMYRYHTLPGARRKAAANGCTGAQYAWESAVTGDEVTPTWVPDFAGTGSELVRIWTGDIELHITADIAYAVVQYWRTTGDDPFMRDYGAQIILETACFWGDRAEPEEVDGRWQYSLRDVIGPDEYHEHVDNNAYTNRMVQWHLQTAVKLIDWLEHVYPERAKELSRQLGLTEERIGKWQQIIAHIIIPQDPQTGLITQFEGFFDLQSVDLSAFEGRKDSMQSLLGIDGANSSQVIKQADVVMLLCLLRDEYDATTWQINWDTYMPLTDHSYGSSLGPSFHAWAACEMDRPDEAYEHFMLAARADLRDVRGNAGDGIHAASAGGLWQAAVFGFAGLQLRDLDYTLTPRLPSHWTRLAFKFYQHGQQHSVDIRKGGDEQGKHSNHVA